MAESKGMYKEVLPKQGQLYQEDIPSMILCKPKLMPLKSVTLEKLEKMQKEAQETVKKQEEEERLAQQMMFGTPGGTMGSSDDSQSDRLTLD